MGYVIEYGGLRKMNGPEHQDFMKQRNIKCSCEICAENNVRSVDAAKASVTPSRSCAGERKQMLVAALSILGIAITLGVLFYFALKQ